jgi:drug/metabolite transporter (DMT)-like permease
MEAFDLLIHLANFTAPAFGLAALMSLFFWAINRNRPKAVKEWTLFAINLVVGLTALTGGLWFFGRDGTMAAYGALVLGVATSQWLVTKAWQN